jgi:uncharacterized protein YegP (UPF0339 family)
VLSRSIWADERWRWRLRAEDGGVVAKSGDGYPTRAVCIAYVRLVRRLGEITLHEEFPASRRPWVSASGRVVCRAVSNRDGVLHGGAVGPTGPCQHWVESASSKTHYHLYPCGPHSIRLIGSSGWCCSGSVVLVLSFARHSLTVVYLRYWHSPLREAEAWKRAAWADRLRGPA